MKTSKTYLKSKIAVLRQTIFKKCLECCCSQPKEAVICEIKSCPLWKNRPTELKGLYTLVKDLSKQNINNSEAK